MVVTFLQGSAVFFLPLDKSMRVQSHQHCLHTVLLGYHVSLLTNLAISFGHLNLAIIDMRFSHILQPGLSHFVLIDIPLFTMHIF